MKSEKKLRPYFILGLVIVAGSVLRIYNLSEKSLNVDDLNSVRDSVNPNWLNPGGHMPLFFYILHLFMYMGTNEFVLRLPAAIFGVLTILLSFEIGRLFFGTKEGLVCAWLTSISTMHIYYSQQVRMYSPLVFFTLLSLFFFYKCFVEKNYNVTVENINLHGFIFSTALNLYTHYLAVFVMLAEIIFLGLILINNMILTKGKSSKLDKRTFQLFVLATIIIFVLCFPIIFTRFRHPWVQSLLSDSNKIAGSPIKEEPSMLELSFLIRVLIWFSNSLHIFYVFSLFFLSGIIFSIKKFKEPITLLLLSLALPIVLLFLFSSFIIVRPQPRYLIYVLPIYILIVSRGIVSIAEIISRGAER